MAQLKEKLSITSVTKKVIAGFMLVFIAILLALGITHFGFREMMETVDQLSAPNKKLTALNTIFQEITALDQAQRADAIKNPNNPYTSFLDQSKTFVNKIDTLRMMDWDSTQQLRLLEIKGILQKRNRLFFSYLKLKTELIDNRSLSDRLDTLAQMLVNERVAFDTSVVTTQKTTVTTSTDSVPKDTRKGLQKLFNRKKNAPQTTHIKVEEQLSVVVDTVTVARQNKSLAEVEKIIVDLEDDQRAENKRLLREELELIHANSLFINQLLSILHDVENEEVAQMRTNNDHAVALVSQSILRISILLIVFFVGAALLVYLIWMDISRSNFYKAQLEKARDEAEELSQIKQRFLANMSHEIRTPLQSILGFAEQLKLNGSTPEAVSAINSSSEHLLHIVDEVLDYSRISSGSFVLSRENFVLLPLVREIEAAVRVQAQRKGLTLLLDLELAEDFKLIGDPFRLRQILYNLIGNAIKFTSKGYVKLSVKTTERVADVDCVFEVSDTGIGIRQDDIAKIFNQFEQANTLITRQFGGTGLGLTIAKSLIEAQGGSLTVSSSPGHGSVFTVNIPFAYAVESEPEPHGAELQTSKHFQGKVIVVDDDTMILRLCSLVLEKNGIDFKIFSDAKKLLAEKADPDVTHILMDIRMPEINGVELCHGLRKKYSSATTFIALTAHVFQQEHQQLIQEGFDFVLLKPFREKELLNLFNGGNGKTSPPTAEDDEVDFSALKLMTQGDEALFQSILQQFVTETSGDLDHLETYRKTENASLAREVVHKLAGRLGQMGIPDLSSAFRELENNLVAGMTVSSLEDNLTIAIADTDRLLKKIRLHVLV